MVILGGADIDLSEAALGPEGARLAIRIRLGGAQIKVPPTWRVVIEPDVRGGEIETRLPDPADLPPDCPTLTIDAVVRGGGLLVAAGDE
jgi:hypothetical protein